MNCAVAQGDGQRGGEQETSQGAEGKSEERRPPGLRPAESHNKDCEADWFQAFRELSVQS